MYDRESREERARRIVKTLADYFGEDKLRALTLLDIGSSTGIMDNILAPYFKNATGTDIDRQAIEFAKNNFQKRNLSFQVANAMKLPFKNNSFDIVVCNHVYEHVPNQNKLFSEIYRVLNPMGVCYLAAQNKLWPWEPHHNLPFLSWLPEIIANLYMKLSDKGDIYYEHPKTYWELKNLTRKFKTVEYTQKIVANPKKFGYYNPLIIFGQLLSPFAKYLSPTFFWLLIKK